MRRSRWYTHQQHGLVSTRLPSIQQNGASAAADSVVVALVVLGLIVDAAVVVCLFDVAPAVVVAQLKSHVANRPSSPSSPVVIV